MRSIVTIEGIDEALKNLCYNNKRSLKYRLINAIRSYYSSDNNTELLEKIDSDELIRKLWETGNNPTLIKNKRKNLNSIKSLINTDLKRLYNGGENDEGIIISSTNVFDMSAEAKSEILESFSYGNGNESKIPLGKIADVLNVINEYLGSGNKDIENSENYDQLKELIRKISGKMGVTGEDNLVRDLKDEVPVEETEEESEDIEDDEIVEEVDESEETLEEIEEIDDADEELADEDYEDAESEEDPEGIVDEVTDEEIEEEPEDIEDDEILEEVDEGEESIEEIEEIDDADDVKELPEEELEDDEYIEVEEDDSPENQFDYSLEEILEDYDTSGYTGEDGRDKAKMLADKFDKILSESDRYYNQYILIPKGRYKTGISNPDNSEKKVAAVDLREYYFGKFPVTNSLFELFIERTGYVTTAERLGYGTVYFGRYRNIKDKESGRMSLEWNSSLDNEDVEGACWYQPAGPGSSLHGKRNHPVVQVSLEDAIAFAVWTGKRLPSEAEWEAASRTARGYNYPWGENMEKTLCNVESSAIGDTTAVDKYKKASNRYGVSDVLGNVLEWTRSKAHSAGDNNQGSINYVAKGGSWVSGDNIRLTHRSLLDSKTTSNILGFRCVAYNE